MSPASSGGIEVERYIGACLITSQSRPKGGKHYPPAHHQHNSRTDRWAGGVPLISFANQRWRRDNNQRNEDPKSHLLVHTQGAPLILANRYGSRNKSKNQQKKTDAPEKQGDNVSVTSDENSVAAENCLPRIIKPRKRRKKDRKPPHLIRQLDGTVSSTDSADSPEIDSNPNSPLIGYVHNPYLQYPLQSTTPKWDNHNYFFPPQKKFDSTKSQNNRLFYHPQQTNKLIAPVQLETNTNSEISEISDSPKLHHAFEDIKEVEDVNGNASSCQCRYCDPCGQIWDIDRSCYSPFLTSPYLKSHSLDDSLIKAISSFSLEDGSSDSCSSSSPRSSRDYSSSPKSGDSGLGFYADSPYGSPTNPFSFDIPQQRSSPPSEKDVRRDYEMFKEPDLKVSTEIVTSLNGHRDLEIKLFSWSTSPLADFGSSDFSFFSKQDGVGASSAPTCGESKDLVQEE